MGSNRIILAVQEAESYEVSDTAHQRYGTAGIKDLPCHIASHSTGTPVLMSQSRLVKVVCTVRRGGLVTMHATLAAIEHCFRR